MNKHIMLDLETYGTAPGSVLRSIGAVVFNRDELGEEFYCNIGKQSCLDAGLTVDPNTEAWWAQQERSVEDALAVNPQPLKITANGFHAWFMAQGGTHVWCQGASFDEPLWSAACRTVGIGVPWKFWNVRDTRTVYELAGLDTRTITREGAHHNALDDAKFQAGCIQKSLGMLKRVTTSEVTI